MVLLISENDVVPEGSVSEISVVDGGGGTEANLDVAAVGAGEKVSEGAIAEGGTEGNGVCMGVSTLANRSEMNVLSANKHRMHFHNNSLFVTGD